MEHLHLRTMLSLINNQLVVMNKSTVGWINPVLYQYASHHILHDITIIGNNSCSALYSETDHTCFAEGFVAMTGWDPVTGLGSVDFVQLQQVFVSVSSGSNNNGFSTGEIAGIVVGSVAGSVIIAAAVYYAMFMSTSFSSSSYAGIVKSGKTTSAGANAYTSRDTTEMVMQIKSYTC